MKGAVVYKPLGKENLKFEDVNVPEPGKGEIRVGFERAGMNPIDYNVVAGKVVYSLAPFPHIPGSEVMGVAKSDGKRIRKGDKVIIYPRIFCGNCDMCLTSREYMCTNGGLWGVVSNGGYAEEFNINEDNLFKMPQGMDPDVAVSLPIGGLTAYHALIRAGASHEKRILIYGASGNTGIFATQLASHFGMEVHAVSRKEWVKDYGASEVYDPDSVPENLKVDIVMNSLGQKFWKDSLSHLSAGGSLVTFGVLTGKEAEVDIAALYTAERTIIGSTGGSRKELLDLADITARKGLKVRVAKRFKLADIKEALDYFPKVKDGRLILEA
ncbi:alcohol dehydrogenase [uncultured archaeon]|nr:alcohol dehydrogenase [uncultured archaeon]